MSKALFVATGLLEIENKPIDYYCKTVKMIAATRVLPA